VEFDIAERLPRAVQRDLTFRGAVGVVEGGARGTPFGDTA
jgi:hypothetical protein